MQRRATLSVFIAVALLHSSNTLAQGAPSPRALDQVVVTGTRVSDRTVAESQSPIDILTPEVLQATGTTELATALSRALPSLNFPRPSISDGSESVRPAQIRGLSPDHVLVLVNGKRYHSGALVNVNGTQGRSSSPVDLNTIPIASIARVEVLRDGASAQYGSDAIAGVINIVLKGSSSGGSLSTRYGRYSAGDGEQYQALGDVGLPLGAGFVHLAAQVGHQDETNRARPYTGDWGLRNPPLGRVVQRYGDPESDFHAFSFNGAIPLTDAVSVYSNGIYSERDVLANGFYRAPGALNNIPEIYPDGFLPKINNVSTDHHFTLGIEAVTAGGTDIDFSYTYGHNELTFDILDSLNRSMGPATPTDFYAGALQVDQHVLNFGFSKALDWGLAYPVTLSYGLEWRGDKFQQSAGELASYVNGGVIAGPILDADGNVLSPGATAPTPGSQVFPGFTPANSGSFDRHAYSFYLDLEADITENLQLGLAARYEDFSDFGDTTNGKISARYEFTPAVALRATASTGFRAPSLQQQYFSSTATTFIGGVPYEVATFRVTDPAAIALGAESLRAEESTNFSLGLVLQPVDALYVTIDAYQIEVEDRITLSENLTSAAVGEWLRNNGFPAVAGGRYFTNAIDTTTRGVDVVGTYTWTLPNSSVDLTLGYNYNDTEIDRVADNPAALEAIDPDAVRFGYVELGRFEVGSPKDKFLLGGKWNVGGFGFSATASRYGEFTVRNANDIPNRDQTYGAKWVLDLAFDYSIDNWTFTLGGDNVLNEYPDETLYINSSSGQLPYTGASPFGFNGAFVYGNVNYTW